MALQDIQQVYGSVLANYKKKAIHGLSAPQKVVVDRVGFFRSGDTTRLLPRPKSSP